MGKRVPSVFLLAQQARSRKLSDEEAKHGCAPEDVVEVVDAIRACDRLTLRGLMTMPPFDMWLRGRDDLSRWFGEQGRACEGSTLIPLDVNGTAGYASYKPGADGSLHPWAIQVIDVADGWIIGHHNFIGPELFAAFGLPDHLDP